MFRQITQSKLLKDVIVIAIILIIYRALVAMNYIPLSMQSLVDSFFDVVKAIIQLILTMLKDVIELIGSVFAQ